LVCSEKHELNTLSAQIMYAARTDSQLLNLHAYVDIRPLLSSTIFPPSKPYIGNAIPCYSIPSVSANVLRTESLGETAVRFRRAIQDFRNGPALARVAHFCKYSENGTLLLPFGPGESLGYVSSWLQSRYSAIEFVLRQDEDGQQRRISRPVFVPWFCAYGPPDVTLITCDDGDAYWISFRTGRRRLARCIATFKGQTNGIVRVL